MKNTIIYSAIISGCLIVAICAASHAQPGSLDPTFGSSGKVTTDVGGGNDVGIALAIQSDGKLVMTGYTEVGFDPKVAVVRFNTNGTLDNTFGNGGKVITSIGNESDYGTGVAIQSDGKIVVGGYTDIGPHNNFAVLRYNTDGSPDSTFGTGGIVITPVVNGEVAYSVAIQSDGKIVLAGFTNDPYTNFFALVRYNTNGTLDNSFGSNGIVTTHVGSISDQIYQIKIQGDGKIVAGGFSDNGTDWDFAIVRYNTNGSLDSTFGTSGIVTTPMGTSDAACQALNIQSDGKIVCAGWNSDYFTEYAVARYNPDGTLDNAFGTGGKVSTAIGGLNDNATGVVIQSDGNMVVGGIAQNGTDNDFGMVRYSPDGSPDSTFGAFGIVTTDFGSNDICLAMAIQSDHKIVAAGWSGPSGARDFAIARYDAGPVGIAENNFTNSFFVYPNPASTQLEVNSSDLAISSIEIYDVLGEKNFLTQVPVSSSKISIDVSSLTPGIYFIQISNEQEVVTRKVLISR